MNLIKFGRLVNFITLKAGHLDGNEIGKIIDLVNDLMPVPAPMPTPQTYVSASVINEFLEHINDARKGKGLIPAIKSYRFLTNAGLKEAKDAVEHYIKYVGGSIDS